MLRQTVCNATAIEAVDQDHMAAGQAFQKHLERDAALPLADHSLAAGLERAENFEHCPESASLRRNMLTGTFSVVELALAQPGRC